MDNTELYSNVVYPIKLHGVEEDGHFLPQGDFTKVDIDYIPTIENCTYEKEIKTKLHRLDRHTLIDESTGKPNFDILFVWVNDGGSSFLEIDLLTNTARWVGDGV